MCQTCCILIINQSFYCSFWIEHFVDIVVLSSLIVTDHRKMNHIVPSSIRFYCQIFFLILNAPEFWKIYRIYFSNYGKHGRKKLVVFVSDIFVWILLLILCICNNLLILSVLFVLAYNNVYHLICYSIIVWI